MVFELRKLWSELHIKLIVLLISIISVFTALAPVFTFQALDSAESTQVHKGKEAIALTKERYEAVKGDLTPRKLKKALNFYQSIPSEDMAYVESSIKYPGVSDLLLDAYPDGLYQVKNVKDFYRRNTAEIKKLVEQSENAYAPWEKEIILEKAKAIQTPFRIDFSKQWVLLFRSLTIVFFALALSAIMAGSRLFSYEKERNMDLILTSINRKKLKAMNKNKILALLSFLTGEYFLSMLLLSVIFFSFAGFTAWHCQIQIEYFTSMAHLSFLGAYLLLLFLGWLCLMTIGILSAAVNALLHKAYPSLLTAGLLVFLPLLIGRFPALPASIGKFFQAQPANGFLTEKLLSSFHIYKVFFSQGLSTAIVINALFLLVICSLICFKYNYRGGTQE